MSYQPSEEILKKYADVLVNYALGGGVGVKAGEVVQLRVPERFMKRFSELERIRSFSTRQMD